MSATLPWASPDQTAGGVIQSDWRIDPAVVVQAPSELVRDCNRVSERRDRAMTARSRARHDIGA